jgi:hypothetical protein
VPGAARREVRPRGETLFREQLVNIQGTVDIQGLFKEHSGNIR